MLVGREVVLPFMDAGPLEILLEERTEVRAESSSVRVRAGSRVRARGRVSARVMERVRVGVEARALGLGPGPGSGAVVSVSGHLLEERAEATGRRRDSGTEDKCNAPDDGRHADRCWKHRCRHVAATL